MWKCNKNFSRLKLKLVDTVIYENGLPHFWIFTAKDGTVMKKRLDKLNPNEIIKQFSEGNNSVYGEPIALFRRV